MRSALNEKYVLRISRNENVSISLALHKSSGSRKELFSFISKTAKTTKPGKKTVRNGVYMLSKSKKARNVVSIKGASKQSGANALVRPFVATTS